MPVAPLNGLYEPGFRWEEPQHFPVGTLASGMLKTCPVQIADARSLQSRSGLTEAEFLARHSFVLLEHRTHVRDWDQDVACIYMGEVEQLIRERLFPGRHLEVQQAAQVLRRGRGTPVPFYADGVHSDGGAGLDAYVQNYSAFSNTDAGQTWLRRFESDQVEGLVWLDFWRPTGMQGPLLHMPLALCDSGSLDVADLVPTIQTGIAPEGRKTHHLSLRHNPQQRWYYYPHMTCEELLVFKLAEFWKVPTPPRTCFHSAFVDPETPPGAELRQSCEYRVGVLMLRE